MFCHGCFCCFSCWMKVKADFETRLWLKFKWRVGLIFMFSFRSSAQYNHHSRELRRQQWWRWQRGSCPEDFSSFLTRQQCFQVFHQDLPTLYLHVPQMKRPLCGTKVTQLTNVGHVLELKSAWVLKCLFAQSLIERELKSWLWICSTS